MKVAWNLQNVEMSSAKGRQNIRARKNYFYSKEVSFIIKGWSFRKLIYECCLKRRRI